MSPINIENRKWTLGEDGIYKSKSPIIITVPFMLKQVTDIIDDYIQNPKRSDMLMILVDISDLVSCSDGVLTMINHSIRSQLKSRLAYFGKNAEFKRAEELFYSTHSRADNFKTFETEAEAIAWLKS